VFGVVTGAILIALGAVCRFNTTALLNNRPPKTRDPAYDEVKVRRHLHSLGIVFMLLGAALLVLGASKI
jgi:hypothetical protein